MRVSRWKILLTALVLAAVAFILYLIFMNTGSGRYTVYVGGYGSSAVKFTFNPKTSDYGIVRDFKADNPSYLALSPSSDRLYGVSESGLLSGVWGYENSSLDKPLGLVKDGGFDPCHIICFKGHLFTANYGKGGISVYPLDTAGGIKAPVQILNFVSDGAAKAASRIHMTRIVTGKKSKNDYILATDKGLDRIHIMRVGEDTVSKADGNYLNKKALRLYRCDSAFVSTPQGYGPRHLDISKDGKFLYLLCETSGHILVYSIRESDNNILLKPLQDTVCDMGGMKASADIHISPDGRFLYASNRRGKDGIAIFRIGEDGLVSRIAYQVTKQWPRSFAITPDGNFMFVCCQKDKTVQIFKIDQASGYLVNTGKEITFPDLEPSCVLVGKY
ncbi:MAG: beta-propeller fold lactonase family protein [Bacteroidales bacterium]|nr:beta-propeller fold lactonase family protein [Bacteroidales bacterium]